MALPDKVLATIVADYSNAARLAPFLQIPRCPRRKLSDVRHAVFLLLLIVAPLLLTPDASAQPATKKVLFLTGSDPNYPGFAVVTKRLRSVIRDGSPARVEFLYELQEGLIQPPASPHDDEELVSYLKRKYEGKNVDLIIAAAAPRLRLLLKENPGLLADIPKVFYDFEEEREPTYRDVGPHVTGVWARLDYSHTLDLALSLHPDARRVVVVAGDSAEEQFVMENARAEFRKYGGRVEFTYLTGVTLAELKDRLAALPTNCVVYYLIFTTDKAGNKYPGQEALSIIAPTSAAPIYGNSETQLGAGIVGGSLFDFEEIGRRLGDVSLRILKGEKAEDIPPQTAPNVTTFDWRELRRWGISEQALPPGSVVRFKQLTFWELYGWYIVGVTAACIIEGLLIAWLLFLRARRRQAENARRQSEERNRAILQAIPDMMFLQTRDGIYLDYRAKDPKDLLVPPGEFLGKNVRDVMPPELAERFLDCFRRAEETREPQVVEYELTLNGTKGWYEARVVSSGENILSVVREITGRKLALDELRRSQERFGKAFKANPQPMSLTVLADGLYLDVNDSFLAMSGYERDEVVGHTSLELRIWEMPAAREDFIRELREQGAVVNRETKFRTKKGTMRVLLSSAELLEIGGEECLLVASSDITERVLTQQALRESEARFRNMADTAPVMIWVSGTDRLCTYVNKRWLDFTGRSMEEELGTGWAESLHPDDLDASLETYNASFDRREPFKMEYQLRRADGVFRWVFVTGAPRFSSGGEFLGYIGSCVDITDRKESERALQEALNEVSWLKNQLQEENIYLQEEIRLEHNFSEIVGNSDAIKYVLHKIEQVAPTDSTVLITGETGTGKELVARAIHGESLRRDRPLVKVNCATLSASLIESELFGHEKGAFTGAIIRKIGRFELADGATIFLDEIGELPPELQAKLLRVIQEGEFERLGGTRTLKVDVRIIAATNRNLWEEVQKGLFREDLWYRLHVFPITMPPLRKRGEDIPMLVGHFVDRFAKKLGKEITSVAPATLNALRNYSWPGNVRELANVIERAVINSGGPVLHVPNISEVLPAGTRAAANKTLEEVEREYITAVLDGTGWRIEGRRGAAKILGLNPSTLRTRIAKLNIRRPQNGSAQAASGRPPG